MERIALLIEDTGERVFALVNPEDLTMTRRAGLAPRRQDRRPLASAFRTDDPLVALGGGATELELKLLFDIDIANRNRPGFAQRPDYRTNLHAPADAASAPAHARPEPAVPAPTPLPAVRDVRELSGPLWQLTENREGARRAAAPPVVHFLWGTAWNMPCAALAIAERFDRFSPEGVPERSWVRIRLRRVSLPDEEPLPRTPEGPDGRAGSARPTTPLLDSPGGDTRIVTDPLGASRPDLLFAGRYGDMRLLHPWLAFNGVLDPLDIPPGTALAMPEPAALAEGSA